MLKLLLAFVIACGLAVPAAEARGAKKVDWSEYLESPAERAKARQPKVAKTKKQKRAKKTVAKKRLAKKHKAKKRGKRRR
jgi:Ni/Co efflux regulator RcnB